MPRLLYSRLSYLVLCALASSYFSPVRWGGTAVVVAAAAAAAAAVVVEEVTAGERPVDV